MTQPPEPATPATPADPPTGAEHVRAALRVALRHLLWLLAALAVLGAGLGYLYAGVPGVWGALIGSAVALVFSGTTVLSHLRTASASITTTAAVVLGAWLAKMVLILALLVLLDPLSFYDRTVLVVVMVLGVMGSAYLDYLAVTASRLPYVEPGRGAGNPPA